MGRCLLVLPVLVCLMGAAPPVPGPKGAVKPVPKRGYLGVQVGKMGDDIVVQGVIAGSPAHNGDMRPGDVLVNIGGVRPANLQTFVRVVMGLKPGQKVKMVVKRAGRERELEVTIGAL